MRPHVQFIRYNIAEMHWVHLAVIQFTPALTTMEHPLDRLGAVAARRLIELIEDSALYQVETHEIVLKSKLKIRRSCGNRKEIYELFE